MDRALLILADWAQRVTFDPAEVDKERGVIIEEWRLRRGTRRRGCWNAVSCAAQGLALRRPAAHRDGRESPEAFPHARLKDFYTTWYRPDLMAVDRRRRLRSARDAGPDPQALRGVIPAAKAPLSRPSLRRARRSPARSTAW